MSNQPKCERVVGGCRQPNECRSVGCCLDVVSETDLVMAQEAYVDARDARRALFRRAHETGWTFRAIGEAVRITGPAIWHLLNVEKDKS